MLQERQAELENKEKELAEIKSSLDHVKQQLDEHQQASTAEKQALEKRMAEAEQALKEAQGTTESSTSSAAVYQEEKEIMMREHKEAVDKLQMSMQEMREDLLSEKQALHDQLVAKEAELAKLNQDLINLKNNIQVCRLSEIVPH